MIIIVSKIITSLEFSPTGEFAATTDSHGTCLISDVNTDIYNFHIQLGNSFSMIAANSVILLIYLDLLDDDDSTRCRWSTNSGESLLYVKHSENTLDIVDIEKKALVALANPIHFEQTSDGYYSFNSTRWIDVCPINGNLLAAAGTDGKVKIFDKRELKVVKVFDEVHKGKKFYTFSFE
mgnify:FL=1